MEFPISHIRKLRRIVLKCDLPRLPEFDQATDYGVLTLPVWARPGSKRTVAVPAIAGGANDILSLDIATTGSVTVKSLPANTTMISLDGVSWEFGL